MGRRHSLTEDEVIKLLQEGRISIGRAGELLGISIYDIYKIAEAKGIELGATHEQWKQSMKNAQDIIFRS